VPRARKHDKTIKAILIRGKQDRILMKYMNPCSLKCGPHQSQLQLKWKIHPNNWVNIETYNIDIPRSLKLSFFIPAHYYTKFDRTDVESSYDRT